MILDLCWRCCAVLYGTGRGKDGAKTVVQSNGLTALGPWRGLVGLRSAALHGGMGSVTILMLRTVACVVWLCGGMVCGVWSVVCGVWWYGVCVWLWCVCMVTVCVYGVGCMVCGV